MNAPHDTGHILRMRENASEPAAIAFTWDVYLFGAQADADPALVDGLVPGVATPAEGGLPEWAHRYGEMGAAARLMWQRWLVQQRGQA